MAKKSNKKLNIFLSVIVFLALSYCAAWYIAAYKINKGVIQFQLADAPALGLDVYGGLPEISGFPFKHKITYFKGIKYNDVLLNFPKLTLSGYPIKGTKFKIEAPEGITVRNKRKVALRLTGFYSEFIMPKQFLPTFLKSDIVKWQKDVGEIKLTKLDIIHDKMKINAKGTFGLSPLLQMTMDMNAKVYNPTLIVEFFVESKTLKPLPAAIAISALRSRSETDEVTGEIYVELPMQISNQNFMIGPITLLKLPYINWPEPRSRQRR